MIVLGWNFLDPHQNLRHSGQRPIPHPSFIEICPVVFFCVFLLTNQQAARGENTTSPAELIRSSCVFYPSIKKRISLRWSVAAQTVRKRGKAGLCKGVCVCVCVCETHSYICSHAQVCVTLPVSQTHLYTVRLLSNGNTAAHAFSQCYLRNTQMSCWEPLQISHGKLKMCRITRVNTHTRTHTRTHTDTTFSCLSCCCFLCCKAQLLTHQPPPQNHIFSLHTDPSTHPHPPSCLPTQLGLSTHYWYDTDTHSNKKLTALWRLKKAQSGEKKEEEDWQNLTAGWTLSLSLSLSASLSVLSTADVITQNSDQRFIIEPVLPGRKVAKCAQKVSGHILYYRPWT